MQELNMTEALNELEVDVARTKYIGSTEREAAFLRLAAAAWR